MCGIAGLLGAPPGPFAQRVGPAIAHRGPDDAGSWEDPLTCLVQSRLAILDLSASGHQPMASPCGRWQIVFNGEIYNHASLRARLEAEGQRFQGSGDTEVLLRWIASRGRGGLADLRGMFAFCLFDRQEGTALLARDPHGIKPLYFWRGASGELAFASELRALLVSGRIRRQPDPEAIAAYLASGSVPEPLTLVAGVQRLQAGHWLHWQAGAIKSAAWMPLPETLIQDPERRREGHPTVISDRQAAVDLTRSALRDSVAAHMVSDVPVGLFLSAGLDSAALLALAPPGLHTFTIGFDDPGAEGFDESEPAARIAALFGAEHTALTLHAEQARAWLPQFLASQDQPSIDGFNTWCVSRLARERGLKVALSGLGGDELFGGYPSFRTVPRLFRWRRRLGPFGPLTAKILRRSPWGSRQKGQRLATFLASPASLQAAHRCLRGQFTPSEVVALLRHWGLPAPDPVRLALVGAADEPPIQLNQADGVAWLEGCRYLRNQLLPDSDVMSMASALELRLPFVDATLQRQLSPIIPSLRLAPGKALLQASVPELPEWFKNRPKQGFRFPFQLWLDDPASPLNLQVPSTPAGLDLRPWYRRWNLMVLETWLRDHLAIDLQHP
jgi:asparagine synthase (glutamine-hydrolysing)